jgi:hypothetical protein
MVRTTVFALALLLNSSAASAQWMVEAFMGDAFSLPTPLTVSQTGYPRYQLTAHYETRPLAPRLYYAWRLARWAGDRGWLVEHVHHKLYLTNPTAVVQDLEVTHGYNLVTLNRGWKRGRTVLLLGAGAVVTFAHSTVRGKVFPHEEPYRLSGVTIQAGAARRFELTDHFFVTGEGKLTTSWARLPVVDGMAEVPNVAVHLLAGGGWKF